MPPIFISYRRTDAPGHAGRLYDRLAGRFGEANVFKDLDSMEPGADFAEIIEASIARCDVVVAVIGPDWLSPRLRNSDDWVRLEIASALKRKMRVVPLLVGGAKLPAASDLPHDLASLTRRHAVEVSEASWNSQVMQLIESLERVLDPRPKTVKTATQEPSETAGADPAEPTRWTAELVHSTSLTWVFHVTLDHETHKVVCRNHWNESVEVDGLVVAKKWSAGKEGLHGVLRDGSLARDLVWQAAGFMGTKRRLTVAGQPLWEGS